MTKFSIIVPVYNVEKYIRNCLESIKNQTYDNYEVIVVNDGTKDNSQDIIDEYTNQDKRFKSYIKENGGLSDARNYGVSKACGDYLVFVDSDDTINKDLLNELNDEINKNDHKLDLIKFQIKVVDNKETIEKNEIFSYISGEEAFYKLIKSPLFVTAWSYAYRKEFFDQNKFLYSVGKIHEDFGLTPLVVIKANCVSSIEYAGYNYYIRQNSIMTSSKKEKMCDDIIYHFNQLLINIEKENISSNLKKVFKSYIANTLISKATILEGKKLNEYIIKLKELNVADLLLDDNIKRKIKKIVFKINPKLYIKKFL